MTVGHRSPVNAEPRVTHVLRLLDRSPQGSFTLDEMAQDAGLSPYHFLRTFERLTGVTPHQYVLRARLRQAALRLVSGRDKIVDVALDCGFGDLSNFNRAFRAEFGLTPRAYRLRWR
jgi:AraC family transcriptional regulator